jgi:FkbM family methyltransferase
MTGAKLVEVDDGVEMFATSAVDARFLYKEIFTFDGYGELALPPGAFVIDVGANMGMFLLRVKTQAPDAVVWAFEPMPVLAEVLRSNVEHHGFGDVTVHEVALGEEAFSEATFTYYPLLPSSSTRYPQRQERLKEVMARSFPERVLERMYRGRPVTVAVRRLSDHLDGVRQVDLLKVDTSGSELEVLAGIDEAHWTLFRRVILDVQDQNGRLATIRGILEGHGFRTAVRPAPMADGDGLNFQIHAAREDD